MDANEIKEVIHLNAEDYLYLTLDADGEWSLYLHDQYGDTVLAYCVESRAAALDHVTRLCAEVLAAIGLVRS